MMERRVSKLKITPLVDKILEFGTILLCAIICWATRSFVPEPASFLLMLPLFYCSKCYHQELLLGLSRSIVKKAEEIKNAEIFSCKQISPIEWPNGDCEFDLFLAQALLMALKENGLCFNPTTLVQLSKELQDDNKTIIGLYGPKGSGKTSLVEAVRDKTKSLKLFDVVLFATVSQDPNIKSIQYQIAESLDLKFGIENKLKRALKIESALESKKRILVILDDVPAKFEVEYIGIPCNNGQCKFLLTTRSKQDCSLIISDQVANCQRMVPMRHLPEEEAWKLLQKHSGIEEDENGSSSKLSTVAKEIASKYKWLPRTIMERGSSLIGKPYDEWEGLLNSLRHSSASYQIFLSFRGKDTRRQFTSTLLAELEREKFKTFMDDVGVRKGRLISTELTDAIKNSRLSIVILSENYADSAWCLQELDHILECKETKKQLVLPVFYNVKPTDVRHQTGVIKEAIDKLRAKLEGEEHKKIETWRKRLTEVCDLGADEYVQRTGMSQNKFIKKIVDWAIKHKNYLYLPSMAME